MKDNLLHISVTSCSMGCGRSIKGDPGRDICIPCIDVALKEARDRAMEKAVIHGCSVIEKRELAEVISINR